MPIEETEKRKPFVPDKVEEIGRIVVEGSADIVVRNSLYKGDTWVDIRFWVKTPKYTGWSKKGLALKEERLQELIDLLQKAKKRL